MIDNQTIYEFSEFRIDTLNKILWRGEMQVPLTPKVFDTLVLLVENAPNLVEKNVLMDKLWHNQFVEESNITFNIKMLRKALEDDANSPQFIETVPRRGYRFIAQLNENQVDLDKPKVQKHYLFGLLGLIAFASLFTVASWVWKTDATNFNTPIFSADFKSTKLTETGKVNHAVISPDGKYVAYTNEAGGKQSLWLRQISNGKNTEILATAKLPFYGLAFSQDSENIFFTKKESAEEKQLNIYKISIFGGVPSKIISESQGEISLTSDDKQIVFVRYEKGVYNQNNLMMVDIDGRNEKIIATSKAPDVFWAVAVSPNGKKIVAGYGHTNNASQNMKLVEIDTTTGNRQELSTQNFFQIGSLSWLENESGFLFTANENLGESGGIWMYNYQNKKVEPLTKDSTGYVKLSLNKNFDRLVATTLTADFRLFIGDNTNLNKYLTQARDGFSFTSDGKIVYAGDAAGSEDIWIMDENGANQKQLTTDKSLDAYPITSKDNHIYFASNRSGENQIWRMNSDGSNQIQLTKKSGGNLLFADEKWVYFNSASDQFVWKVATDGSEESQLFSQKTGFYQAFSPDGSQMAYLFRNQETNKFEIAVIALDTQKIVKQFSIPDGKSHPYFLNWTSDGKSLTYLLEDLNEDNLLQQQDLDGKPPKVLFNLGNEEIMDCQISPNGKNYVFIRGSWKHDAVLLSGLQY